MRKEIAAAVSWILVSFSIVYGFGIRDEYFPVWSAIISSFGISFLFLGKSLTVPGPASRLRLMVCLLFILLLIALSYILWPFNYHLSVVNEKGHPVLAHIRMTDSNGRTILSGDGQIVDTRLWKGRYSILVEAEGYLNKSLTADNGIWLKKNEDINQEVRLEGRRIRLSSFRFVDPTVTLSLKPSFHVSGSDILGDIVDKKLAFDDEVLYGSYGVSIYDRHFENTAYLLGDRLYFEGSPRTELMLYPGKDYITLNASEVDYVMNFLGDYLRLSQNGILGDTDRGFPKQFYLYGRDHILSLGDILFLFCEYETYASKKADNPLYFVPEEGKYAAGKSAGDLVQCYGDGLDGFVPASVGDSELKDLVFHQLVNGSDNFRYGIGALNYRRNRIDVAFTFDIESGRYVPYGTEPFISPCRDGNFSLGLADSEKICDSAEYVAWMTPREGEISYTEYPYPQVSGILGFREILNYSERYGIPTTDYFTKKDLLAFDALEPSLIDRSRALINDGLLEVGSHTRYHTYLDMVTEDAARREMDESKKFLEGFFNISVWGFRGPYLSLVANDVKAHARALEDSGYTYYSQAGVWGSLPGSSVVHKPYNLVGPDGGYVYTAYQDPAYFRQFMEKSPYVITLDHPWNLVYRENGTTLVEDRTIRENMRAIVLTAISNGGKTVKVKDLEKI